MNAKSTDFQTRLIEYRSVEYHQLVQLRQAVLRTPLGLAYTPEDLEKESGEFHFAVFAHQKIVGGFILAPVDPQTLKLRQFAVAAELQGQGIGKKMLVDLEGFARQRGIQKIMMHARETAVPFYERNGYQKRGERFTEVTLPHWYMEKTL
jgi:ribosomal protein S18 acetylase RimI-like enzyme